MRPRDRKNGLFLIGLLGFALACAEIGSKGQSFDNAMLLLIWLAVVVSTR